MHTEFYSVCPLLGLENDPTKKSAHSTSNHRCYAQIVAFTPYHAQQSSCCLTVNFARCTLYMRNREQVAAKEDDEMSALAPQPKRIRRWRLAWKHT